MRYLRAAFLATIDVIVDLSLFSFGVAVVLCLIKFFS
jgi:hypothetical protein